MKLTISKTFLVSVLVIASTNADAAKLYKWVDADGNVSYQDQPPPKSGKILSEKDVVLSADQDDQSQSSNVNLPKIVVYSVKDCEPCTQLIAVLNQNKLPHIELPLENDREAQSKILEKASSISAPTIFIGEKMIQNVTGDQLIEELRSAGFEV